MRVKLKEQLKKILFISDEVPQSVNAGSIQFYRIFKNYPADKLIVFGPKPSENAVTLNCKYYELNFPFHNRLRHSRFTSVFSNLQSVGLLLNRLPNQLQQIADDFKPDVVVTLMQHLTYYYPAYDYAKNRKIPLVLFCHDDAEEFAGVHKPFLRPLLNKNSAIYSYATKRICISPEMANRWKLKYGVEGDYFYPVASDELEPRPIEMTHELIRPGRLTIGYAGSLSYGYLEGIAEIIPALESANATLKIYRKNDGVLPPSRAIEYAGFGKTAEETWSRIKEECDAVILPYSTQHRFRKLYSTHFPSKLPEYVSLGMPVIINGPAYANGVRWGKKHPNVIYTSNVATLAATLTCIKEDAQKRVQFVKSLQDITDFKAENLYSIIFS